MKKSQIQFLAAFALAVSFLVVCTVMLSQPAWAQSTYGTITGSVTDASGGAVADAQVTLTNQGTSEKRTQSTGSDGLYTFVNLFAGKYKVDAEKAGFKRTSRTDIVVEVQQTSRIDLTMQVGAVNQVVEVTGETPLLQPETSSLGEVVEQRQTDELPLNGRNIFNLAFVAPSVVPQGNSYGTPVGKNPFDFANFQVGGSFGNQSAEYLDGQPLNIGYINLPVLIPTQDSIQEFKVQTSNLGAEWGRFAGGVTNLTTKGGTSFLHGEVYEYLRNRIFNANDYFLNAAGKPRPAWVQNQFGAEAGGPLPLGYRSGRNRTFWFISSEGFRLRTGEPFTATVPTAAERAGDFSAMNTTIMDSCAGAVNSVGACPGSAATPTPFQGNVIPASRISPTSKALLNLWPAANSPGVVTPSGTINNFDTVASTGGSQNQLVARVDQDLGSRQRLMVRLSYWNVLDLPVDPLQNGVCLDRCSEKYSTDAAAVSYNYSLNPATIFDLHASISRFKYNRSPKNAGFDLTSIDWPSSYNATIPAIMRTPPTPCVANFADNIMCTQGQSFIQDRDTQYNLAPSLTLMRGRHRFHFGIQYQAGYDNYAQTNVASGAFDFCAAGQPCFTGFPFAD